MAKQLLIYEKVVPITMARHGGWSLEKGDDYSFSARINACPLMVSEFRAAGATLPIIFTRTPEGVLPAVILGIEPDKSLMVGAEGRWTGRYIPAFIRRYPFVFAMAREGDQFTLCIDEEFSGLDPEGRRGDRLFDDEGRPTEAMNAALEFTRNFEVENRRTIAFCKVLEDLNLLTPMNAQITRPDGARRAVTGFQAVSRERLKALNAEQVKSIFDNDALELIYVHLMSLANLEALSEREG